MNQQQRTSVKSKLYKTIIFIEHSEITTSCLRHGETLTAYCVESYNRSNLNISVGLTKIFIATKILIMLFN